MTQQIVTKLLELAVALVAPRRLRRARRAAPRSMPCRVTACASLCSFGAIIGSLDGAPIYEWVRVQVFDAQAGTRQYTLRYDGIGSGTPQHHFDLHGKEARLLVGRVLYTSVCRQP
jgi:hypothetical protein